MEDTEHAGCPCGWSRLRARAHKALKETPDPSGTGVATDLFNMLESSLSLAVFDAGAELTSFTDRFAREFPKRDVPKLAWAVSGLLRGTRDRQSVRLGRYRVVLQRLQGDQPCVIASAFRFPDALGRLSPRQQEIAELAAEGATSVEVSQILHISVHTVRQHLKEVYRRLDVGNRAELVQILAAS